MRQHLWITSGLSQFTLALVGPHATHSVCDPRGDKCSVLITSLNLLSACWPCSQVWGILKYVSPLRGPASSSSRGRNWLWSQPRALPYSLSVVSSCPWPQGATDYRVLPALGGREESRGPHCLHTAPRLVTLCLSGIVTASFNAVITLFSPCHPNTNPFCFPLSPLSNTPSHSSPLGKQVNPAAPRTSTLAFMATYL